MKKIIFIEDVKEHFIKYSNWIQDTGYATTTWDEVETLRNNLKKEKNHIQVFKNWIERIDKDNNIIAFVLDININIPKCDGLDLQRLIRRDELYSINTNYKKLPIIILTSNNEKDDEAHNVTTESPDRFIVKEDTNKKSFINKINFEIRKHDLNITSEKIYDIVKDTNNKVTELGVLSKIIVKTLPELTDKKKANKIIEEWEQDKEFRDIMTECFPSKKQDLFKKLQKFTEQLADDTKENMADALYEQATLYFEKEAEIDEEDTKMIQFLKYSTYIVEKIGEAVHK